MTFGSPIFACDVENYSLTMVILFKDFKFDKIWAAKHLVKK